MTVDRFMADFLVAGADYYRLDDAVHEYLEGCESSDAISRNECIRRISDSIAKCVESIAKARESGRDAQSTEIPSDQVYEDVVSSYGLVCRWDDRVSLLISMMRTIALETDADCIELLARSRETAHVVHVGRPGRTLDIADGVELFSEVSDEEPVSENEDAAEDAEVDIEDAIGEDNGGSDEDSEIVDGWMPSDIPANGKETRVAEHADHEGAVIFVTETSEFIEDEDHAQAAENAAEEAPVEKPLTREEIQSIVLETMKEFLAQSAPAVTEADEQPKRRKPAAAKAPRRGIRRKKAADAQEADE